MQLSKKQIPFCQFFPPFYNVDQSLSILKKKITLTADVFWKIRTTNNVVRKMSKKSWFRGTFDKQIGKSSGVLHKSARQHSYYI